MTKPNKKDNNYSIKIVCKNCGLGSIKQTEDGEFFSDDIVVNIPKGMSIKKAECPNCGCKKLSLKKEE